MTIFIGANSAQSYSNILEILFFCDGLHDKVRIYRRFDRPAHSTLMQQPLTPKMSTTLGSTGMAS